MLELAGAKSTKRLFCDGLELRQCSLMDIVFSFPLTSLPPCVFQVAEELAAKREAERKAKEEQNEEDEIEIPVVKKPAKVGKQVRQ